MRAREREEGSKRMEVVGRGWGEGEREEGCGRWTLEPWTTTIKIGIYSLTFSTRVVYFCFIWCMSCWG